MGKSGKKSKSDRINALRKQYDAFLDEDKKRKDRNEFILGRLEKMRLCTAAAVVPVRHYMGNPQISKYPFATDERFEHLRKVRFDDTPILRSRPIDVIPDITKDEHRILQEISKKYILIPKLQSTNESSVTYAEHPSTTIYNPSSVSNDADWRNKYHILDELKKIEKEGSSDVSRDEPVRDNFINDHELRENMKEQKTTDNRDIICNTQQNNDQSLISELQEISDYNGEIKSPLELTKNIVPNVAIMTVENEVNEEQNPISNSNRVTQEFYLNANNENVNFKQVQDIHQNEMKESTIAPKHTDEVFDNDINEPVIQNTAVEPSEIQTDNSNYYTTTFSEKDKPVQNLKNDEVITKPMETNPSEEPYATEGENMPISENIQQQEIVVNENVIPSQIDEFEAEQKEMFYSENAEYNQNSDSVGYTQNEDNTIRNEYSYYNESQQEQPYFAEINEHEESTERYDPNYAQQYAENYEDNVNAVQYENQQYGVDNYENQPEVANVYYEQQPDQLDLSNAVYEQQPDKQEMTDLNYGQQPVNYEYEQSHLTEQSHSDNMNAYDPHASEHVNYETQQYNEVGEVDPTVAEQNVYENPQEYVHTEQDTIQNVEQHLDQEEGYIETENVVPIEPAAELENISDPNVKET